MTAAKSIIERNKREFGVLLLNEQGSIWMEDSDRIGSLNYNREKRN